MKVEVKNERKEKKLVFPFLLINNTGTIILAQSIDDDCYNGIVIKMILVKRGIMLSIYQKMILDILRAK